MSPSPSPHSPSTPLTTPDQSPGADDDIWATDNDTAQLNQSGRPPTDHEMLSDLPSVKRQHMTDGYREGLSVGKSKVIQSGFDTGYPIGVVIAFRVGEVLGVLEGHLAVKEGTIDAKVRNEVKKMYEMAKVELDIKALLKGMSDEVLREAKDVRGLKSVDQTLRKWEDLVLGKAKQDG